MQQLYSTQVRPGNRPVAQAQKAIIDTEPTLAMIKQKTGVLLGADKFREAFDLLEKALFGEDLKNKLILLRSAYTRNEDDWTSQMITRDEYTAARSRMGQALLNLADQHEETTYFTTIASEQHPEFNLLNNYPLPEASFVGRTAELEKLHSFFQSRSIIIVEGWAGMGKTDLVAAFIDRYLTDERRSIIWFQGNESSTFDTLVDGAGLGHILNDAKNNTAKWQLFAEKIEELSYRIFIDNFQDIRDAEFLDFLNAVYKKLRRSRVMLVTRFKPEKHQLKFSFANLDLHKFSVEESYQYVRKLVESDTDYERIPQRDIDLLVEKLDGYPIAFPLALELLSYGERAEQIFDKITEHREFGIISRLLDNLFRHPETTREAEALLIQLSIFKEAVSKNVIQNVIFHNIADENITFDTLYSLIKKNIVSVFNKDGEPFYQIHPLIREFCYELLPNKRDSHVKAALYFISCRTGVFSLNLEYRILYHSVNGGKLDVLHDVLQSQGEFLFDNAITNYLKDIVYAVKERAEDYPHCYYWEGKLLDLWGRRTEALESYQRALLQAEKSNDVIEEIRILREIGWVYDKTKNQGNDHLQKAEAYFQRGYELAKKHNLPRLEAKLMGHIANIYEAKREFAKAIDLFDQALDIAKSIPDRKETAILLGNKGIVLYGLQDLDGAIHAFQEADLIFEELGNKKNMAVAAIQTGNAFKARNELDQAVRYYQKAVRINSSLSNKPDLISTYGNLGDLYRLKNDLDAALINYQQQLDLADEINDDLNSSLACGAIGTVLLLKKNYEAAKQIFSRQVQLTQKINDRFSLLQAYGNLGTIFQVENDLYKSLIYFEKQLELTLEFHKDYPEDPFLLSNLGFCYFALGKVEEAEMYMGKVFEATYRDKHLFMNMGHIKLCLGKDEEAKSMYADSLALREDPEDFLNELAVDQNLLLHNGIDPGRLAEIRLFVQEQWRSREAK